MDQQSNYQTTQLWMWKKTGRMPLSRSLSTHAKKKHVFDGLYSASLISLYQLCDNDWIAILQERDQYSKKQNTYFKRTHKQDRWFMVHTHIKTIETLQPCNHHKIQDEKIIDPISSWILLRPHPKNVPGWNKNGNFLTWPGLNNQHFMKHIPSSIVTFLGHMDQERKNLQSTKQVK